MAAENNSDGDYSKEVQPGQELWRHPDPKSSQMWEFIQRVNKEHDLNLATYDDLYQWSIKRIPDFWAAVWQYVGIRASQPYEKVTAPLHSVPTLTHVSI